MGGILSAPKMPSPPPAPPPPPPPVDEEKLRRQAIVDRNRRGRAGLINTSARGVFAPAREDNGSDNQASQTLTLGD